MRQGSLFSGIGGFDLAAEWMGWENVFHCEWNEFGQKVLKYYWPKSISYGDITKTDFTIHRGTIDILTGGFPCQPFSMAGQRKGTSDNRYLWPEMLRAINEIQPKWIVGENVSGLVNWDGGMVFNKVQADLEASGYEIAPFLLPACAVNAPHRRERIWFVAHPKSDIIGDEFGNDKPRSQEIQKERFTKSLPFTNTSGFQRDSEGAQGQQFGTGRKSCYLSERDGSEGIFTHPKRVRQPGQGRAERQSRPEAFGNWQTGWSDPNGGWPTQSPVCSRDDGLSSELVGITLSKHRNESLKGYGNAVVPQLVYQIFKAIEQYERL